MTYILLLAFVTISFPMGIALIVTQQENRRLHELLTTNTKEYRKKLFEKLKSQQPLEGDTNLFGENK